MTKEEYISLAVGKIRDKKERRLAYEELSDHIDERVNFYCDCGYDAKTAFKKAVSQMGPPETAAKQLGMVHSTLLETIGSVFTSLVGLAAFLFIGLMSFLIAFFKDSDFRFYFLEFYIFEIIAMAITIGFALYSNYKKNKILSVMSAIFISLMLFFGVFYLFFAGSDLVSGIIMLLKNGDAQESFKSAYQEFLNIRSPLIIILYTTVTGNAECVPAMIKLSSVYFQSLAVSIASVMFYAALAVCIYRSNKTIHRFCSDNASKSDCEKRRRLMRQLVCFALCIITVVGTGAVVCLTSGYKSDKSNYCTGFYIVESDSETDFESIDYENARKIGISQNIPLT
ncbi:MAG: hypothetical protein IJU45_07660, partial [Clostridia bacterium]|nr:hypothetical protein [Clostridia bacterium]